jgi:exodeoxyribonuclease VII small subunit
VTDETPELPFEKSLERLEAIVGQLERGDAPLEQGLALFEEGVRLTRACHEMLAVAEQRVSRFVQQEGGEVRLEPFGEESAG